MLHRSVPGPRRAARVRSGLASCAGLTPALLLVALTFPPPALAGAPPKPRARTVAPPAASAPTLAFKGTFGALSQRYLAGAHAFDPPRATRDGLHAGDGRLGGLTRDEIMAELGRIKGVEAELLAMKPTGMTYEVRLDYERLLGRVQYDRIELETVRRWERDPGYYLDRIAEGLDGLASRRFAPAPTRLARLIEREKAISPLLAAALENISQPPRPWVELALRKADGLLVTLESELPAAFAEVTDPALQAEFQVVNAAARKEIESFRGWIKDDLLPGATADFALGSETMQKEIAAREGCEATLFRLERLATDDLAALKLELEATARGIDNTKSTLDLLRIYAVDHVGSPRLNAEAAKVVASLRDFCAAKVLFTLPAALPCTVATTPAFQRPLRRAGLLAPGPWESERRASDYVLRLSPPEPGWDALKQEDYLRGFNRFALPFLVMRESYPGRLAVALLGDSPAARANAALAPPSAVEGWALYVQRLLIDQGYGGGDAKFRLFQIRAALLETCRFLAALRLHTAGMTREQAVAFFVKDGLQDPMVAEQEALAATLGIDGMAPLIGRLHLQKLAADYRRAKGDAFSLKSFHDALLSVGPLPIRQARQALLPGDKAVSL